MKRITLLGLIAAAILILVSGIWFFYVSIYQKSMVPSSGNPEYDAALKNLQSTFGDVLTKVDQGDTDGVYELLETKAKSATNPIERGSLLLTLAQLNITKDVAHGVQLHKEIAADETIPNSIRAASLIELAVFYYNNTVNRDTLTENLFTSEAPFGDMAPNDTSDAARESAYADLLTYADDLYPTSIANGYLAKYWGHETFLRAQIDTADITTTDTYNNAAERIVRTRWLINQTAPLSYDLNPPISRTLLGLAELYIANTPENLNAGITDITQGMNDVAKAISEIAKQNSSTKEDREATVSASLNQAAHVLWKDILTAAVDIKSTKPEAAKRLAEAYMSFINSPEGAAEHAYAIDQKSDIAPLIKSLQEISEPLQRAF